MQSKVATYFGVEELAPVSILLDSKQDEEPIKLPYESKVLPIKLSLKLINFFIIFLLFYLLLVLNKICKQNFF